MAEPQPTAVDAAEELTRQAGHIARLEELTRDWDEHQSGILSAIRTAIEEFNAEAFRRMIRSLREDPACAAKLNQSLRDPYIYHVLRFHGLVKEPLEHRLARALDEVRPFLKTHGGDVELVAVRHPDTIEVRLVGACHGCPASGETLTEGVEKAVRAHCPEIQHVRRVSHGAPETAAPGAPQVVHFISPFARQRDENWLDAGLLDEIPDGGMVSRSVRDREVLLYRNGARVACVDNACAHMGMPLDGGELKDGTLRCPYHGFTYLLETGECLTVPEVQLAVHAVKVVGNRVSVRVT